MVDSRQTEWHRQRVEQVFGLTGGELEDHPWEVVDPEAGTWWQEITYQYWYDGLPDYADTLFPYNPDHEYRTVVLRGEPPFILTDKQNRKWKLCQSFTGSGEAECPNYRKRVTKEEAVEVDGKGYCPLCESSVGMNHGIIYLGEDWSEAVYQGLDIPEESP